MKKYTLALLVLGALLFLHWWKPRTPDTLPETIIVGTSADFPPFSAIDDTGTIGGFDIDLIDAVFKKINRPYILKNMPFESLLPHLQLGSLHVIAAGLSYSPARAQRILFSQPPLEKDPFVIVTRAGQPAITSLEGLAGKRVLVNHGYTSDLLLSQRTDLTLIRLPGVPDALLALDHDHGDAFVVDRRGLCGVPDTVRERYTITVLAGGEEPNAFGISKKYPALVAEINNALNELAQDGTIANLAEKWKLA